MAIDYKEKHVIELGISKVDEHGVLRTPVRINGDEHIICINPARYADKKQILTYALDFIANVDK